MITDNLGSEDLRNEKRYAPRDRVALPGIQEKKILAEDLGKVTLRSIQVVLIQKSFVSDILQWYGHFEKIVWQFFKKPTVEWPPDPEIHS